MIVENDHNQRHLYGMILENLNPSVEILEVETVDEAINILENEPVDIVLSELFIGDDNCKKIYQYISYKKLNIPFILLTKEDVSSITADATFIDNEDFKILEKPVTEPMLSEAVDSYMEFDVQTSFDPNDISENFCKIKIHYFLRFNKTDIPIFIKLSNCKFVKVFHDKYHFDSDEIHRYLSRGAKYLYIAREDFEHFKVSTGNTPFLSCLDQEEISSSERWKRTQEVLSSMLLSCGVNERSLRKAFSNIERVKDRIFKEPDLEEISTMVSLNNDFYTDHSLLTAVISGLILERVEWNSEANLDKLLLASLLHDAALDPDIASIMESNDLERISELSESDHDAYYSHPKEIAELINLNEAIHAEVSTIILEHHEKPDGSGFPRALTAKHIHPLSSIFILAHDLVEQLYAHDFDPDKMYQIKIYLEGKYNDCHFESAYAALLEALKNYEIQLLKKRMNFKILLN